MRCLYVILCGPYLYVPKSKYSFEGTECMKFCSIAWKIQSSWFCKTFGEKTHKSQLSQTKKQRNQLWTYLSALMSSWDLSAGGSNRTSASSAKGSWRALLTPVRLRPSARTPSKPKGQSEVTGVTVDRSRKTWTRTGRHGKKQQREPRSVTCVVWNWNFEGFGEDTADKFLLLEQWHWNYHHGCSKTEFGPSTTNPSHHCSFTPV